ncbi:methionine biosynthesis protein MetW, partial [Pseudomonas aeruginosa]|uniref:methionine biosynthesis protein MetW n=1 Tax=Pseudomonas aeruginosa TaxID=287 RepID=UPI00396A62D0
MRADLEIIQEWIPAGSRVLDLGCGDGELLAWLRDHKQVSGYGLEIDPDNIARCIENGVNVIEQDTMPSAAQSSVSMACSRSR